MMIFQLIKARKAAVVRDNDGIQVKEIILDSAKGVQVIEHYEENGNLTHEQRIIIVNIILDWTFERKLHLPRDLQKLITTQICEVFPTEKTVNLKIMQHNSLQVCSTILFIEKHNSLVS